MTHIADALGFSLEALRALCVEAEGKDTAVITLPDKILALIDEVEELRELLAKHMIDWSCISDEEFIEQANIRTAQGHWSPDRFMTQFQSDDRAKLGILRSAIIETWLQDTKHPGLAALHLLCDKLDGIHGNPIQPPAFAINTTFVGKETAFQDHSPAAA